MKNKVETRIHLVNILLLLKYNLCKICQDYIRLDNGIEFDMKIYFNYERITHQTSCTKTPEQNEIVERKHQHVLKVAQALIF